MSGGKTCLLIMNETRPKQTMLLASSLSLLVVLEAKQGFDSFKEARARGVRALSF